MNDLRRELAPVTDEAWAEIEEEARRTLETYLAARKLVDVSEPRGWKASAANLGRFEALEESPVQGVETRRRTVQPLLELRVPFELSRRELDDVSRGALDPDLEPVVEGARKLALAEDRLVFYGFDGGGVSGLCPGCTQEPVATEEGFADYPRLTSEAINVLAQSGIAGPYALALGPDEYTGLSETVGSGGYPIINHVRNLVEGPIVWAPALTGGLLLSLRGGDFALTLGRDVSIGYLDHDAGSVYLYLEESLTFRLLTPEAAVPLQRGG